jgi:alkylated DNA nucleotide flippase Atl1
MRGDGVIDGLYLKRRHGELTNEAALQCIAGLGIVDDVHANRLSPRQVLLTLSSELEQLGIAPGALQENIVISCEQPDLFRPGSALLSASGVEIALTMFCEPCKRIAHLAPKLGKLIHRRGVLGGFVSGGELRAGEAFELIAGRYAALPESSYQNFLDVVAAIPAGRVLRYADVAIGMGVADGFVRALPGYIRRSMGRDLPLHRIVNARGQLPDLIPGQAAKLGKEGVAIRDNAVPDLSHYLFDGDYNCNAAMRFKPST